MCLLKTPHRPEEGSSGAPCGRGASWWAGGVQKCESCERRRCEFPMLRLWHGKWPREEGSGSRNARLLEEITSKVNCGCDLTLAQCKCWSRVQSSVAPCGALECQSAARSLSLSLSFQTGKKDKINLAAELQGAKKVFILHAYFPFLEGSPGKRCLFWRVTDASH